MTNKIIEREKLYIDVANLHIESVKTGFLPTLGPRFLALMYRSIDEAEFSTLIVEYKHNKLAGFVSGTLGTSSLYRAMMRHPLDLLVALFPVIISLRKLTRILNIMIHMSGEERAKYPKAELLTICVCEDHRRQGVAERLYKELSRYFKESHISKFVIVVGQSLDANAFYKKQGANISGEVCVHSGTNSNLFIQEV